MIALRLFQMEAGLARRHYAEHEGKPFYEKLISYITACPIVAAVFEGTNAVETVRKTMGATNPAAAEPGTIRGDLGLETGRNLIHGSDSLEAAKREVALFFREDELCPYPRDVDRWLFEAAD
jgi:nucleoside-diphosphate kinase